VTCRDHDSLLCIANTGYAYAVRAFNVPEAGRQAKGSPVASVLPVRPDVTIEALIALEALDAPGDDVFLVLATKMGAVKKTPLDAFRGLSARGLIAIKIDPGDEVKWARLCRGRAASIRGRAGAARRRPREAPAPQARPRTRS